MKTLPSRTRSTSTVVRFYLTNPSRTMSKLLKLSCREEEKHEYSSIISFFCTVQLPFLLFPSFFLVLYRESQYNILYTTYPFIPTRRKQNSSPLRFAPSVHRKKISDCISARQHFRISLFLYFYFSSLFRSLLEHDKSVQRTRHTTSTYTQPARCQNKPTLSNNPHSHGSHRTRQAGGRSKFTPLISPFFSHAFLNLILTLRSFVQCYRTWGFKQNTQLISLIRSTPPNWVHFSRNTPSITSRSPTQTKPFLHTTMASSN